MSSKSSPAFKLNRLTGGRSMIKWRIMEIDSFLFINCYFDYCDLKYLKLYELCEEAWRMCEQRGSWWRKGRSFGRTRSESVSALVLVVDIKSTDSFRSAFLLITVKMDNVKVCWQETRQKQRNPEQWARKIYIWKIFMKYRTTSWGG